MLAFWGERIGLTVADQIRYAIDRCSIPLRYKTIKIITTKYVSLIDSFLTHSSQIMNIEL